MLSQGEAGKLAAQGGRKTAGNVLEQLSSLSGGAGVGRSRGDWVQCKRGTGFMSAKARGVVRVWR